MIHGHPADWLALAGLPLAPISAVTESDVPAVVGSMGQRLTAETPPEEAREVWAATRILMGLRWSKAFTTMVLKGVQGVKESVTYQEIVEEGIELGREAGRKQGREEGREEGGVAELKKIILSRGQRLLGTPDEAIRSRLDSIRKLDQLEQLTDRLLDGMIGSWNELLPA